MKSTLRERLTGLVLIIALLAVGYIGAALAVLWVMHRYEVMTR